MKSSSRCLVLAGGLLLSIISCADVDKIHFLIPGAPGGGWDGTARGIGQALLRSNMVSSVSYENLSGGGGGRAIAKMIETASRQQHTLLINSTPIVVRSLQKIFPQSFRDLTPIASVIADYSCFVVRQDSAFKRWSDVLDKFRQDPRQVKVAGGSVRGNTDHIVIAQAFKAAGLEPRNVIYVPYDAGGKAIAGLLSGETQLLSTGVGEALQLKRAGEVRILAVSSASRLPELPGVATLTELGYAVEFANWRGFFGPPGLDPQIKADTIALLEDLLKTQAFEEVRRRNGWAVLFHADADFYRFLEQQELAMASTMRDLGFLR